MIKLTGDNGDGMTLEVLSYEFPGMRDYDGWDSEWLDIEGTVSTRAGSWSFTSACLSTFDLCAIALTFRALRDGQNYETDFVEPVLKFRAVRDCVIVTFAQEAAPPWATEDERYGEGVAVGFPTEKNDLEAVLKELDAMSMRFPVRYAPSNIKYTGRSE